MKEIQEDLKRARDGLDYSFKKIQNLNLHDKMDDEELETWESFSSRFARFSDMLIARYFRAMMLSKDPAFRGSIIDLLNQAEKFGWIDSARTWLRIRELRNVAAHDYTARDYLKLYKELAQLTPTLMKVNLEL